MINILNMQWKELKIMTNEIKTLPCYKMVLPYEDLSKALGIEEDIVITKFRDGRTASPWVERWAAMHYGFECCQNSNQPGFDGMDDKNIRYSVRCLTKVMGIKSSIDIGGGRKQAPREKIEASIKAYDFLIIVDIFSSPDFFFFAVPSNRMLQAFYNGDITEKGAPLKREKVYKLFADESSGECIEIKNISSYSPKKNCRYCDLITPVIS